VVGLFSVVSKDGVCEVQLAGSGTYTLMSINGKSGNLISSAMHILCNNALIGTVEDVLRRYLSLTRAATARLLDNNRMSVTAAFESPESVWSYLCACPDVSLVLPDLGLVLRHSGLQSKVWRPYVNSREVFDGKVGDTVPPIPAGYPIQWRWGKYTLNTVDVAKALRCLHVDARSPHLRDVLVTCAMVAYDKWLLEGQEGKLPLGPEQAAFEAAVKASWRSREPGGPRPSTTDVPANGLPTLCGVDLRDNLTKYSDPSPGTAVQQFIDWLQCLRLPMFWNVARSVADRTTHALSVLSEAAEKKCTTEQLLISGVSDATYFTDVFPSGSVDILLRDVKNCDPSLLAALAAFLSAMRDEDARAGEVQAAVDTERRDGQDKDVYLDQWTAKLAALRLVLLGPFMAASRDCVLDGMLSTVRALHDLDWRRGGYDRDVFNSLSSRGEELPLTPRVLTSVLTRQPGDPVCGRMESFTGIDVSSILAVQVSGEEVYSDAVRGRPILFCIHDSVFQGTPNADTKQWLSFVLRSPLCRFLKRTIVKLAQNPGTVFDPLDAILNPGGPQSTVDEDMQPAAKLTPFDQVCAFYALALRCPMSSTQRSMYQLVTPYLGATLEDLLMRKSSNIYGTRILSGLYGVPMLLGDMNITCEVIELEATYQAKSETDDVIYSRIRAQQQASQACFVYLKGLPTISNELFKWLAEYTRRTPWCYVFLENTSTAGLFPESIDRLVTNPTSQFKSSGGADSERGSDATMRVVTVTFETIKSPRLSYLAYPARSKVSRTRLRKNFIADFNVTFIAALTATKSPVILLSGAPGIGKSHFMKFFRASRTQNSVLYVAAAAPAAEGNDGYGGASESKDCHGDPTATATPCSTPPYVFVDPEVDGSDDIFTRIALRDVLRMKADTCTVTDGVKIVLIVDEYHFMTKALKLELLAWYRLNNHRFVLLLVSNRFDEHDKDLFSNKVDKAREAPAPSMGGDRDGTPQGIIIEARGTVSRSILCTALPMVLKHRGSPVGAQEEWQGLPYLPGSFTPALTLAPTGEWEAVAADKLTPKSCTDCGVAAFVYVFITTCYGLFGDEMLSLRFAEPIVTTWLVARPEDRASAKDLMQVLLNKHSYLPVRFVQQFVDTIKTVTDPKVNPEVAQHIAMWWQCVSETLHGDHATWPHTGVGTVGDAEEASLHRDVGVLLSNPKADLASLRVGLTSVLSRHQVGPSNDLFWCLFISGVAHTVRAFADRQLRESSPSCVEYLVYAALLSDDGESMSFPEFSNSGVVSSMYQMHPVYRLAQWVQYMYAEYGAGARDMAPLPGILPEHASGPTAGAASGTSEDTDVRGSSTSARTPSDFDEDSAFPILWPSASRDGQEAEEQKDADTEEDVPPWAIVYAEAVRRFEGGLSVIDMPLRFPQVFLAAGSLESCEVASKIVDPMNLEEIARLVKLGWGIAWGSVVEAWARSPITNASAFRTLCGAMSTILEYMVQYKEPRVRAALIMNLQSLIKTEQDPDMALTKACWRLQPRGGQLPHQLQTDQLCIGFVAAWKLYRYAPLQVLQQINTGVPAVVAKLSHLLLWASRFGSTMLDAGGELAARRDILVAHLMAVSTWIHDSHVGSFPPASIEDVSGDRDRLGNLWCNAFAPLLGAAGPMDMDFDILLQIARSRALPNPGWPAPLAALCRLVHNVYTPRALVLLQNPRFWANIADRNEGRMPSDISNTLVTCTALPSRVQQTLLYPPRVMTVNLGPAREPYVQAVINFMEQLRVMPRERFGELVLAEGQFLAELRARHQDLNTRVQRWGVDATSTGGYHNPVVRFEYASRAVLSLAHGGGAPWVTTTMTSVGSGSPSWARTGRLANSGHGKFDIVLTLTNPGVDWVVAAGGNDQLVGAPITYAMNRSQSFLYQASAGQINSSTAGAYPSSSDLVWQVVLHVDGAMLTVSVKTGDNPALQPLPNSWTLPSTFVVLVSPGTASAASGGTRKPRCSVHLATPT